MTPHFPAAGAGSAPLRRWLMFFAAGAESTAVCGRGGRGGEHRRKAGAPRPARQGKAARSERGR